MARLLFERAAEWAARFADNLTGRNVLLGIAVRQTKRSGYVEISLHDRTRLQTEAVVEVAISGDTISLRPTHPELGRKCHITEIGSICEGARWKVTNTYLTDLFGRRLSKPGGFLPTVRHFVSPVEIARDTQFYQEGWDALKQELGTTPSAMSMTTFAALSRKAILSRMSREQASEFMRAYR